MRKLFIIICLLAPSLAFAANGLTVGTLTLYQTFISCGVNAAYTGDDNEDATAVVEYKLSSDSTWITAHAPVIERRAGQTLRYNAITSLFYLTAGSTYDVRVTWTDADGVTGTNPVTGQVTMWSHYPPTVGSTCNASVTNWTELSSALTTCSGSTGTITLADGNYGGADRTISINGSGLSGFVKIVASNALGAYFDHQVIVSGDYIWIYGIDFRGTNENYTLDNHGIYIQSAAYTVIDHCQTGANIRVTGTVTGLLLESNTIRSGCTAGGWCDNGSYPYQSNCILNSVTYPARYVIRNNDIYDCRDGIGQGAGNPSEMDVHNNLIGNQDDGFELDGAAQNARYFNNRTYTYGVGAVSSCSMSAMTGGPAWIFNNVFASNVRTYAHFKCGGDSDVGKSFVYYNTIYVPDASSSGRCWQSMNNPDMKWVTWKNNICRAKGPWMQAGGCGWIMTNSNFDTTGSPDNFQWHYNDSACGTAGTYNTIALWLAAHGADTYSGVALGATNILNVDSLMTDPENLDFNLQSSSTLINAGTPIAGIFKDFAGNTRSGSTPSIGAYEYGASYATPVTGVGSGGGVTLQ